MIAAAMVYTIIVSALVLSAARALEGALRALRVPVRFVWLGAMCLAIGMGAWRTFSPRHTAAPRARDAQREVTIVSGQERSAAPSVTIDTRSPTWPSRAVAAAASLRTFGIPAAAARLDAPLATVWVVGSLLWCAMLVASALRVRRQRAEWQPMLLDGAPVYASHDVGPALFGIVRHSIVVPQWVAFMNAEQRRLIIAHEREHARAGDPMVLFAASVLMLLQPWNPLLWYLFHRLRFEIETDCDARVLARTPDLHSYGALLLDVGERTLGGLTPVAALSEPYSQLGSRIEAMTRAHVRRPVLRAAAMCGVAAVVLTAAFVAPRPVLATHVARGERAIVRITSVGLENTGALPRILVYSPGRARVGIGRSTPLRLDDTLHLFSLPAMSLDVTDADVHLQLASRGTMSIGGQSSAGGVDHFAATGRHIVVLQGGAGVRTEGSAGLDSTWRADDACVPAESWMPALSFDNIVAMARRLHPAAFAAAADSLETVAMVFDNHCELEVHGAGRRSSDHLFVDEAIREIIPHRQVNQLRGGFGSLRSGATHGGPWIVWAEEAPQATR